MNDDFPHRIVASCIVAPLYAVLLYVLVIRPAHLRFREKFPVRCLHYSILDVWGLTLGLTPTLVAIAYGFRDGVVIENHIAYVLIAELLGLSQLSGAYLALLRVNEVSDWELKDAHLSWNSSLTLLMGTVAGIGLLAIIPVVALATGIALWLIYLIFQLPFGVPLLVAAVYFLIWFVWRLGTRP